MPAQVYSVEVQRILVTVLDFLVEEPTFLSEQVDEGDNHSKDSLVKP